MCGCSLYSKHDAKVDRMIAEADISGDGRGDYSEFAHLWKTFLLAKHQKPAAGRLQQVPSQKHRILFCARARKV